MVSNAEHSKNLFVTMSVVCSIKCYNFTKNFVILLTSEVSPKKMFKFIWKIDEVFNEQSKS